MIEDLDITQYPGKLFTIARDITSLRNERENLELSQRRITVKTTEKVDLLTYKNAAVRENFILSALADNAEYVKIENRISEINAELRKLSDDEALVRRCYRILEQEYMAHGTRTFKGCAPMSR